MIKNKNLFNETDKYNRPIKFSEYSIPNTAKPKIPCNV